MYPTSSAWPGKGALDGASSFISWFYLDTHVCPLIAMGNSVWRKGFLAFQRPPGEPQPFALCSESMPLHGLDELASFLLLSWFVYS